MSIIKIILFASLVIPIKLANGWELSQLLKYNNLSVNYPDASLLSTDDGYDNFNFFNYRVNVNNKINQKDDQSIKFETHYLIQSAFSNRHNLIFIDPDQHRLFDLTKSISDHSNRLSYHRLDRLFVTFNTTNYTFKAGRQAISWGNGLIFNILDIVNPFSPTAIDTEYKPGDDMFYLQSTTTSGNDWQLIYLPRRDSDNDLDTSLATIAAKYHHTGASADFDFLFAQHYDKPLIGFALNKAVAGSVWRLNLTHSKTLTDQRFTNLSSNIDYSWTMMDKNIYGFLEYFYSGIGLDSVSATADNTLLTYIQRGSLFTRYRDYFAGGLRIELHPLLNFSPTVIHNLIDNSSLLSLTLKYDWQQDLSFTSNITLISGNSSSEYAGSTSPGNSLQLLLSYYF